MNELHKFQTRDTIVTKTKLKEKKRNGTGKNEFKSPQIVTKQHEWKYIVVEKKIWLWRIACAIVARR